MTTHLRFLHVCDRQFIDLAGDDPQQRRCDACATTVHNLDAMAPDQQMDLLARAMREKTTVCVSLAVPEGAAQACRAGEPVTPLPVIPDDLPVRMTAGVAMWHEPIPPRRGDADCVWQTFTADPPAVTAAVDSLTPTFGLRPVSPGHWQFTAMPAQVHGVVVVVAEAGATAVGVRVQADWMVHASSIRPLEHPAVLLALVVAPPLWLVAILVLSLSGLARGWPAFVGASLGALALVGVALAVWSVSAARELWGRRAVARSGDVWRRRFWPALAARLVPGQPYR